MREDGLPLLRIALRNLFDQHFQAENRVTHALLAAPHKEPKAC